MREQEVGFTVQDLGHVAFTHVYVLTVVNLLSAHLPFFLPLLRVIVSIRWKLADSMYISVNIVELEVFWGLVLVNLDIERLWFL